MESVRRVFVEKRPGFDIEAQHLLASLREDLGIKSVKTLRIFKRYDFSGVTDAEAKAAKDSILSEPNCDFVYDETLPAMNGLQLFAVEPLPGQYDQRADSAAQCVQLLTQKERPVFRTATVYAFDKDIPASDFDKINKHLINPVEARQASLDKPDTLEMKADRPADVRIIDGFRQFTKKQIEDMVKELGMAMSVEDLAFCQEYFRDQEKRDPSFSEIRVIDTYWSDHCRHTTFHTAIDEVEFELSPLTMPVMNAYTQYKALRKDLGRQDKTLCLMDIATIGARELKCRGKLDNLDASDEINACSIVITADVDGEKQEWLVMYKNETHNHPTEIEPFGGAATCLGGAIRDPLSGRSYVYQAMRITGAADPRASLEDTLPGKLPQRQIVRTAAAGYSSYGNQIGLPAGKVHEIYHPGFMAKRFELGAVIAAAPRENVVRGVPQPGDVIVLIGGRTGRDGCGGATGSSKAHTGESLKTCGAEVQKGNPLTERNIQRLFRNPDFSKLVKRCNDFGAGGVCVAIGELAPGLSIDLDKVPKKYEGLDGTELAISESQERMACVFTKEDVAKAIALAADENLEATPVAVVTENPRLTMTWRGKTIIDIARSFLDTNGVTQHASVFVEAPSKENDPFTATPDCVKNTSSVHDAWLANLQDLNVCSQKGLVERFDATVGASTVISPYGGKTRLTPNEAMAAKLPVAGKTNTCTLMSYGYDPYLCEWSPFHGALYSVIEAIAKIAAAGGDPTQVRMSFQEYFERLNDVPESWGKPFAALLGGLRGQLEFNAAAIGGKDSMSGTFENIHVPPTLVAIGVAVQDAANVCTPEFKGAGHRVLLLPVIKSDYEMPHFDILRDNYNLLHKWITADKAVISAQTIGRGGMAAAISKMAFGNLIGFEFHKNWSHASEDYFKPNFGSVIVEVSPDWKDELPGAIELGKTIDKPVIIVNEKTSITLDEAIAAWTKPLETTFPTSAQPPAAAKPVWQPYTKGGKRKTTLSSVAKPRVFIPVFPGTNCEYDTQRAFERAGAVVTPVVIRNLNPQAIEDSITDILSAVNNAQIIAFPGGFSSGDEPDGSGKFIATTFRNPRIAEAVQKLLNERDGLAIGICNGFQALIKLGLVPYGQIKPQLAPDDPTLTFNTIGRHAATTVNTVVASNLSPWLMYVKPGDVHAIPISHGEGRFVATAEQIASFAANGQIAFQYCDLDGKPAAEMPWNPNGSACAIEGITSPDGRVLGKMGHSERVVDDRICINVPGSHEQKLFQAGVDYFK
ncbi:MAG: phosphoribosylformylglycinamidine synthase [Victivallales bacterium]|nr:phosphoribosylformylglycinamidine synthase [Victivallales bacterium]